MKLFKRLCIFVWMGVLLTGIVFAEEEYLGSQGEVLQSSVVSSAAMSKLSSRAEDRIDLIVAEEGGTNCSIAVVFGGNLVFVKGYGRDAARVDGVASVSKSVLTTLALRLHEAGKINIYDDITHPDGYTFTYNGSPVRMTLQHLLSNRSGLPGSSCSEIGTPPQTYTLRYRPGTHYAYCNNGFNLAIWEISRQLCAEYGTCGGGRFDRDTYRALLDDYINGPMCTAITTYDVTPSWGWLGSGCIKTSAAHLALMNAGLLNNDLMTRSSRNLMWTRLVSDESYSMGWFVQDDNYRIGVPGIISTLTATVKIRDPLGKKIAVAVLSRPGGSDGYAKASRIGGRIGGYLLNQSNPCAVSSDCTVVEEVCDAGGDPPFEPPEEADFMSCENILAVEGDLSGPGVVDDDGEVEYLEMREGAVANYVVYVPESTRYTIYGRVYASGTGENSAYARVDRNTPYIWSFGRDYGEWVEREIDDTLFLSEGVHEIQLTNREEGARVHWLRIDPVAGCDAGGVVGEANLLGYWKFDDVDLSDEAVVEDSGPYQYHGRLRNYAYRTDGISGDGIFLNGHYDYIHIENSKNSIFNMTDGFTLSGWVRPDASPAPFSPDLVSTGGSTVIPEEHEDDEDVTPGVLPALVGISGGYQLGINIVDGVKRPMVLINDPDARQADDYGNVVCIGGTALESNEWHHLAATYNSSSRVLSLYTNGVLSCQRVLSIGDGTITYTSPTHMYLGRWAQTGAYLYGVIDEVKVYDAPMSPHQIMAEFRRLSP
jgi:hypothetical protein